VGLALALAANGVGLILCNLKYACAAYLYVCVRAWGGQGEAEHYYYKKFDW
jgi:hypothetical protein